SGHVWLLFFFSSRRRHTRWPRDWSSDVCSSDLGTVDLRRVYATVLEVAALAVPNGAPPSLLAAAGGGAVAVAERERVAIPGWAQIGRASCREREWITRGAECLKK